LLLEYGRLLDITGGERRAVPPVLEAVQFLFIAFDLKLGNLPAAQLNAELLRWLCDHSSEFECEI
jgi:hypothetical protein